MNYRKTCSWKGCYWFWPDAKDLCERCKKIFEKMVSRYPEMGKADTKKEEILE